MVAPSFVTEMLRPLPVDCKILSYTQSNNREIIKDGRTNKSGNLQKQYSTIPLGPNVDLTKSAIAMAPIKEAYIYRYPN